MIIENKSIAKPVVLLKVLEEKSDEEHPLEMSELIDGLAYYGIRAERKSIYKYRGVLSDAGYEVTTKRFKNKDGKTATGYYLKTRTFKFSELRLLCDAVRSAKFLSPKDTNVLLETLKSTTSNHLAKRLCRGVCNINKAEKTNWNIFKTIDILDTAIETKKKVSFFYGHFSDTGNFAVKNKAYTASPYGLVWAKDGYYLICNRDGYDDIAHYRLDRMTRTVLLDTPRKAPETLPGYERGLDISEHVKKTVYMYSRKAEVVELKFKNSMMDMVKGEFGHVPIIKVDAEHFKVKIEAGVDGLIFWLLQCGNKCEILRPDTMRQEFKRVLQGMLDVYGDSK